MQSEQPEAERPLFCVQQTARWASGRGFNETSRRIAKKYTIRTKKLIFFFTAMDGGAKLSEMDGIPSGNCTDANILNRSPGTDNITS
jgi:hypothetical protein